MKINIRFWIACILTALLTSPTFLFSQGMGFIYDLDADSIGKKMVKDKFFLRILSSDQSDFSQVAVRISQGEKQITIQGSDWKVMPGDSPFKTQVMLAKSGNPSHAKLGKMRPPFEVRITRDQVLIKQFQVLKGFKIGIPVDEALAAKCEEISQITSPIGRAIRLMEAIERANKDEILCLLSYYNKAGQAPLTIDEALVKYQSNPFLAPLLQEIAADERFDWQDELIERENRTQYVRARGNLLPMATPQSSLITDGLNALFPPTEILAALGRFTADRFEQELNIAFLNQIRLEIEKSKELQTFFPSSRQLLAYSDMFNYTVFLNDMRKAFDADLTHLDRNIIDYLRIEQDNLLQKIEPTKRKQLATAVQFSLLAYDSWKAEEAGFHPAEIVRIWGNYDFLDSIPTNVATALKTLAFISKHLEINKRDKTDKIQFGWASKDQLLQVSRKEEGIRAFLGFVYEADIVAFKQIRFNIKQAEGSTTKSLWELFQDNSPSVAAFIDFVYDVMQKVQEIQQVAENLKKFEYSNEDQTKRDQYKQAYNIYSESISDLMSPFMKPTNHFWQLDTAQKSFIAQIGAFFYLSRQVNELVLAAREREYEQVLIGGMRMLGDIYNYYGVNSPYEPVLRDMAHIGTFMTTVARADSVDQILKAIEAAALPVGSYSIKRSNAFSASINAFVGGAGGWELTPNRGTDTNGAGLSSQGFLAFSAPIGIALNWGPSRSSLIERHFKEKKFGSGPSHSLFFSLIDIGAITALNLGNDTLATLPALAWENVFAPGAHYYFGIPRTPVAIGLGVQYGPALRSIKTSGANLRTSSFRIQGGITVDIPFYHFGINPNHRKQTIANASP